MAESNSTLLPLAYTECPATGHQASRLSAADIYLFNEGNHVQLWHKLGAHYERERGGTHFAVWAPNARQVSVIGEFNDWNKHSHPLQPQQSSGIWEGIIPDVGQGTIYKYHIVSHRGNFEVDKADPFGFMYEVSPRTGSRVWNLDYAWHDEHWMQDRGSRQSLHAPLSIYEVHLGSWRRVGQQGNRSLSYRELAFELADHVTSLGFTHVEFLPVMEHPFFGSWGYQTTGYFAPSSRYGTPQDFKFLIDHLHQRGIGVILDWVPSHFPNDEHGLVYFDGTNLYEHEDARQGFHPDWKSSVFNYGRHEVRQFLLNSALFWLEEYHADGLRVDAVASMLYLDYSRKDGEWIPNHWGGRENLDAIQFLQQLNREAYSRHPGIQIIAEESTAWPMVTQPTYVGGLGFGMKWDMGWSHDTLDYFSHDPIHRKYQHGKLTFRMVYAFHEHFVLSLSHDDVVYGKRSLLEKMPGNDWRKFAQLRLLYAYMYGMPGKKLMFMGCEFGQRAEWNHDASLQWHEREDPQHGRLERWVRALNEFYAHEPALHELDSASDGFEWIDANDIELSVLSFLRKSREDETIIVVCNFTPIPRTNYRVGVPYGGYWQEMLNSDAVENGGSGQGNFGGAHATPIPFHGRPHSLNLTLPPFGALFFKAAP
jgi:1,4-alpha-glucan branching enzyme